METTGFNTEVYGSTGWARFSTPMVGGTHASQITEANKALDAYIAIIRKSANTANSQYLATFNALAVQLHAIGVVCVDGKPTI